MIFAGSAFAWSNATWPTFQYPVRVPKPLPRQTAPNGELVTALLAGSSTRPQDGWQQVYIHGDAYQRGFQDGYLTAQNADYFIWGYALGSGTSGTGGAMGCITWPSGNYGVGTPVKGAAAIKYECMSGVAIWPLIPVEYQQELEGIADGMAAYYQALGLTCPDNLWDVVTSNASTGDDYAAYTTGGTITAASVGSPTEITTAVANGLVSGMTVTIAGSNSTPSINGSYPVTVLDSTHFTIPVAVTAADNTPAVSTTGRGTCTFTTATPPPVPVYEGNDGLAGYAGGLKLGSSNAPVKLEALPTVSKTVQAAEKKVILGKHPRRNDNHCSSFVATGPDWTTDGRFAIDHDAWYGWNQNYQANVMLYIHPTDPSGHQIGYDNDFQTFGGNIWCGQDYYSNNSGFAFTETTISDNASSAAGIPIFARCAEVAQYADTCNNAAFSKTVHNYYTKQDTAWQGGLQMGFQAGTAQSNGEYANEWLMGDLSGTIASLQLGTLAYDYNTSTDGFFGSCNWGWGPNTLYEKSMKVPEANGSGSVAPGTPPARWKAWMMLAAKYRGKSAISPEVTMQMAGDDFDSTYGLAHHGDGNCIVGTSSNPWPAVPAHYGTTSQLAGVPGTTDPPATIDSTTSLTTTTNYYGAYAGTTSSSDGSDLDGKITTASMAENGLQTWGRWGYANGQDFFGETYPQNEADYFAAHPISVTIPIYNAGTGVGATESGNTVTMTSAAANALVTTGSIGGADPSGVPYPAGGQVTITGALPAGYNGTYPITIVGAAGSSTTFTYTDPNAGLAPSTVAATVKQAESPQTTVVAWEDANMIGIVDNGLNGNARPWTLMGEAVSVSGLPAHSVSAPVDIDGWTNQPVHLTFTPQASWKAIMYKVDRGGWRSGTSVTIPAPANGRNDGEHTVSYYAVSGRSRSPLQSCTVTIDTQGPRTVAANAPKKAVSGPLTINLQASDGASGVATDWYATGTYDNGTNGVLPLFQWGPTTWYSLDGGPWTEGTQVTVSGSGLHTLSFYSVDNAGNKEVARSITVKIS